MSLSSILHIIIPLMYLYVTMFCLSHLAAVTLINYFFLLYKGLKLLSSTPSPNFWMLLSVFSFWLLKVGSRSSPNIVRVIKSRRMRWAGHVAHMGEERGVYWVLVGKPEGRRPLGRPRRRWVDIRMDLQEVGCGYID